MVFSGLQEYNGHKYYREANPKKPHVFLHPFHLLHNPHVLSSILISSNRKIQISWNFVLSIGFPVITTRVSCSTIGSHENI